MKIIRLDPRRGCGSVRSCYAARVALCVLTIAGAWPARTVNAEPFGEFRFLQADNTRGAVDPTIFHAGPFAGNFQEFDDSNASPGFLYGLGVAFSKVGSEDQDLDGVYRSRDVYGVFAESLAPGRKYRNITELDHYSRYRKCNDDASLSLTITQLFISAFDGGPHDLPRVVGDYFVGLEPEPVPQLVGSIEMEIVVYRRATRFAHIRGLLALNLFVDRQGDDRWPHANFSLANSGGDFWRGAQLEFKTQPGPRPNTEVADYWLTAPHRITIDLASVPTAPSCAISEEDAPDDQGEFMVAVYLKARAETSFFSSIESTSITTWLRDPADLNNNEDGVVIDVVGAQRLARPDSLVLPSAEAFEPDPNCIAP